MTKEEYETAKAKLESISTQIQMDSDSPVYVVDIAKHNVDEAIALANMVREFERSSAS